MKTSLDTLPQRPGLSAAPVSPRTRQGGVPTGFVDLDDLLPDAGWPAAGITEILSSAPGIGELSLLMPALARLAREQPRWIAWVAPPHLPHAPALAGHGLDLTRVLLIHAREHESALNAAERALASGTCAAVLAWSTTLDAVALRRLQRAAHKGGCCGFVMCPGAEAAPAVRTRLRLAVGPAPQGLCVDVQYPRGRSDGSVQLDIPHRVAEPFFFRPGAIQRPPRRMH